MNCKKVLSITIVLFLLVALASCDSEGGAENEDSRYKIDYTYGEIYTNYLGDKKAVAICEITNTGNETLYLPKGTISLKAHGSDDEFVETLVGVQSYPNVIAPGEKSYYFEISPSDKENGSYQAVLDIEPDGTTSTPIRFEISQEKLSSPLGKIDACITGLVTNTTDETAMFVDIIGIAFNENDKPFAVSSTTIDSLSTMPFGTHFEIIFEDIPESTIERFEVFACATY